MYRFTTPKHTFILPEEIIVDYLEWANLSYSQCNALIKEFNLDKIIVDSEDNSLIVHFTQEETSVFEKGTAKVQLRVGYEGEALTTDEYEFKVYDVINRKVLPEVVNG